MKTRKKGFKYAVYQNGMVYLIESHTYHSTIDSPRIVDYLFEEVRSESFWLLGVLHE
jgi:hypothetical protein